MKRIFIVIFIFMLSCENWLETPSFDKVETDKVFRIQSNTQKALNGLYIELTKENLYGLHLSGGLPDIIAQRYLTNVDQHIFYDLSNNKYQNDNPKKLIDKVWSDAYKVIAYSNKFLEEIVVHKEVYSEKHFKMYYGEALAVRTLLHFDLLRLFGPSYNGKENDKSIPYYSSTLNEPAPILSADVIADSLLKDIDKSIELLANDPILTEGVKIDTEIDFWESYRNIRMNIYAAYALKARMCLYFGKVEEAYKISSSLLNNQFPENGNNNNFTDAIKPKAKDKLTYDYVYFSELLFGIHNTRRTEINKKYFSSDLMDTKILAAGDKMINELYESSDLRQNMWSNARSGLAVLKKYQDVQVNKDHPYLYEIQPVIRLGEIYLIAAETSPDEELKKKWLSELRVLRGFLVGSATGDLNSLLEKEYMREFYGEGQYFFFAKRKNISSLLTQTDVRKTMTEENYRLPFPDSESNYRYDNLIED